MGGQGSRLGPAGSSRRVRPLPAGPPEDGAPAGNDPGSGRPAPAIRRNRLPPPANTPEEKQKRAQSGSGTDGSAAERNVRQLGATCRRRASLGGGQRSRLEQAGSSHRVQRAASGPPGLRASGRATKSGSSGSCHQAQMGWAPLPAARRNGLPPPASLQDGHQKAATSTPARVPAAKRKWVVGRPPPAAIVGTGTNRQRSPTQASRPAAGRNGLRPPAGLRLRRPWLRGERVLPSLLELGGAVRCCE